MHLTLFAMGSYDEAEVCELVGSLLLHKLARVIDKNLSGLYRDDGLALWRNTSGPEMEKLENLWSKFLKNWAKDYVRIQFASS